MNNYNKVIWEGWTIQDFINDLNLMFIYVQNTLETKKDVKKWCMENQPYYKKYIPEVVNYFYKKLNK